MATIFHTGIQMLFLIRASVFFYCLLINSINIIVGLQIQQLVNNYWWWLHLVQKRFFLLYISCSRFQIWKVKKSKVFWSLEYSDGFKRNISRLISRQKSLYSFIRTNFFILVLFFNVRLCLARLSGMFSSIIEYYQDRESQSKEHRSLKQWRIRLKRKTNM